MKTKKNGISFKSKYGWISLIELNNKITELSFKKNNINSNSKILKEAKRKIVNFFSKKNRKIILPHKIEGQKLQIKVWKEIEKIKYGKTSTYGKIARKLKISPRQVGKICGQNKLLLIIPCHRIIRKDGKLGGFSGRGGIKLKNKLLKLETI
tara:strand:+ start:80 stop:535 length:456 start_codon:yes stop_codon:yes gene_type:complete